MAVILLFRGDDDIFFNTKVKYSTHICPYIFNKALIYRFEIPGLSQSFIRMNQWKFTKLRGLDTKKYISVIFYVSIYTYKYHLDNTLLDEMVFREMEYLIVSFNLASIDEK